jgi:hypothetical protein
MTKNFSRLTIAAVIALLAGPALAQTEDTRVDDLARRFAALEAEMKANLAKSAEAAKPPAAPTGGWWNDTKVSGRMYYNVSSTARVANGIKQSDSGVNFDIKRFYVGIDHTFDPMFSANITTDLTYDSTAGTSQIFVKKAYLQAKIAPELTLRVGAADLPWVPYVEGIYGYRYLEQTLIDRTKYGTSSDWGVHALGTLFDGVVNYAIAAVNGGGYKKAPTGGGTNHFKQFDYEGRISAVYDGFNLAVGGYTGTLGATYSTATPHTAERFNILGAYVASDFRAGIEYFGASDYSAALVSSSGAGDAAHGVSGFASYSFAPQWGVFGRIDAVTPSTKAAPRKHEEYYTAGVSWSPTKIVDFALAYKHDDASNGTLSTGNGTIGGSASGRYNEVGIFGNLQW